MVNNSITSHPLSTTLRLNDFSPIISPWTTVRHQLKYIQYPLHHRLYNTDKPQTQKLCSFIPKKINEYLFNIEQQKNIQMLHTLLLLDDVFCFS